MRDMKKMMFVAKIIREAIDNGDAEDDSSEKYLVINKNLRNKNPKPYPTREEAKLALKKKKGTGWQVVGPIVAARSSDDDWYDTNGDPHDKNITFEKDRAVLAKRAGGKITIPVDGDFFFMLFKGDLG